MDFVDQAKSKWESQAADQAEAAKHQELIDAIHEGQATTVKAIAGLASVLLKHEPRVKVKNPTTTVSTPDIKGVVTELQTLVHLERTAPEVDNTPLIDAIEGLIPHLKAIPSAIELPEPPEEVSVNNLDELKGTLEAILKAVQADDKEPIIVPAPEVNVPAQDLGPIIQAFNDGLAKVEAAIKAIPQPVDDDSAVIDGLQGVRDQIAGIRFPIPNVITDPLVKFKSADEDATGTVQYYGLIDNVGGWVILKRDTSGSVTTDRYAAGSGAYTDNWSNRSGLTYDYLNVAING